MRPELIYVDGTSIIAIAPRCEPFLMTAAPSSQGVIHPFDHYYLAPELLRLQPPTAAADVFSLGALLAMLVTGEHPFVGDMPYEQLVAILRGDRRPWTGPADLAAVVARALDPDPRTARRRPRSPPSSGSPRSQGHFRRGAVLHPGPPAAVPVDSTTYYGTYGPMVLRRCRKLLGDEQAARDAMHDVFVQVLSRADALDDRAPSSLLFRIATNVCLNRLRTRKRRPEDGDPDLLVEIAAQTDPAARSAARSALDLLFRNEPDDTAVIAVLHLVDKMTLEEVAAEVGMSVSGIRKRLAKLRSKLHALEVPS
ncbi:MAG: sigma-70 family RNA polymerase sigma factor [Kofleriaceae bacterium]